ncbi:MAG: TetR/AcrR family transcriptional regulator [Endomicrobium sp.]|jgi:AcrR family transcriptional regulator|nr:TetR/AcrR family transcriptional regulator [Endomicrobium sp.]
MSRPSKNIDVRLIELGTKRMFQCGIAHLSIRSICIDAQINLGMFYYYFKSKENFIKVLFQKFSEDLTSRWYKECADISSSIEKLKKAINMTARMMKEQRGTIEALFKDFDFSNQTYMSILKEIHSVWESFYINLIDECKRDSYINSEIESEKALSILFGSVKEYAKLCEMKNSQDYYERVNELIEFLIEKLK